MDLRRTKINNNNNNNNSSLTGALSTILFPLFFSPFYGWLLPTSASVGNLGGWGAQGSVAET
jgi:hypothetical protein